MSFPAVPPVASSSRPIRVSISSAALRHNYLIAQTYAARGGAKAFAVVKANAYGHGIDRAVRVLGQLADGFAVLEIGEAIKLRAAGCQQPILMLEGFFAAADLAAFATYRLTPVVHRFDQLDAIEAATAAGLLPGAWPVFLKVNSGMNRLGFNAADLPEARRRVAASAAFGEVTLMMHFAEADGPRGEADIAGQRQRWQEMTGDWPGPVSMANSAALLRHPEVVAGVVRPGIMLYGASPFADQTAAALDLQPVMTLTSEIIGVQEIGVGEKVGYGGTFVAERPSRIGIVACGYADGYPRHAPSGTPILVGGQRSRTVGRVSMDMMACDLTDLPAAGVGSPVTLWGDGLPADEVATAAGTIAYELFCALAARVPVLEV
jgi:alanine racemase